MTRRAPKELNTTNKSHAWNDTSVIPEDSSRRNSTVLTESVLPSTTTARAAATSASRWLPRHPAFSPNRVKTDNAEIGRNNFSFDRPFAGILVIGGILLFVSMSLTAAVIVFCKKKNTVFVLQKSEEGQGDDSDLELDDILTDFDSEWRSECSSIMGSHGDLRYMPLLLQSFPPLIINVDTQSGQRVVSVGEQVIENRHASAYETDAYYTITRPSSSQKEATSTTLENVPLASDDDIQDEADLDEATGTTEYQTTQLQKYKSTADLKEQHSPSIDYNLERCDENTSMLTSFDVSVEMHSASCKDSQESKPTKKVTQC